MADAHRRLWAEEPTIETSAEEARRGKDVQGMPWDRFDFTRQQYREFRMRHLRVLEDLKARFRNKLDQMVCKATKKGSANLYEFRHRTSLVKPSIYNLRNLLSATSKHDVYLVSDDSSIIHWSTQSAKQTEFLNVGDQIRPPEVPAEILFNGFPRSLISTMTVKDNLLVAAGLDVVGLEGVVSCKYLYGPDVSYSLKIPHDYVIIAVEIYHSSSGATQFMISCNDSHVRVFEGSEKFAFIEDRSFPWSVNHMSVSPDNKLLVVAGNNAEDLLLDCETGKTVASLRGHLDCSFASAWHPDGRVFATGSQDTTCRLWDVRNTSRSLEVLMSNLGAIASITFSSDGKFMAMAETTDFVHVYDTEQNYNKSQEIDFFGGISGISFSPDTQSLFIGFSTPPFQGLLEYGRRHEYFYLDSLI